MTWRRVLDLAGRLVCTATRAGALVGAALLLAVPLPARAVELDAVLAYLGFDTDAKDRLRAGEIVSRRIAEGPEKTELAISVAALFPASLEEAYASVVRGDALEVDRNVIEFRRLTAWPPDPAEFAAVGFGADETSEVAELLAFRGGSNFNLSADEIARFRGLGVKGSDEAARAAVNAAYRSVLLERYRAYRQKGLAGLAPYDRGSGRTVDPGRTLRLAAEAARFLREAEPALYRAWLEFPAASPEGVEHFFYWIKQRVQDRPTFVLSHRSLARGAGQAVLLERQYFIGHSYNSVQIVTGALPVQGGIVVIYTSRTSIDQMAGLAGSMARPIAAGKVAERVRERFEALRARQEDAP